MRCSGPIGSPFEEAEHAQIDDADRAEQQRHADEVQALAGREQPGHIAHDVAQPRVVERVEIGMHVHV
jgi:hypothetical protein